MTMARFLYIDLPRWSADLARRAHRPFTERLDDGAACVPLSGAVLVFDEIRGQRRIHDACDQARSHGVRCGMTLAEARALFADRRRCDPVHEVAWREDRDACVLHSLALQCHWVTPVVALDSPRGLILDLRGCERLIDRHGGEVVVIDRVESMLRRSGIHGRLAIANTAALARGWARHGAGLVGPDAFRRGRVIRADEHRLVLDRLPIAALELDPDVERALSAVRIRTVGELRSLPRSTVPVRYGLGTLRRLDETEGRRPEVLTPVVFEEPVEVVGRFAGPARDPRAIDVHVAELARTLASQLLRRGLFAVELEIRATRPDRSDWFDLVRCAVGARRASHLWSLLRPASSRIPLDDGIDEIRILLTRSRLATDHVGVFWTDVGAPAQMQDCEDLLDRVVARFGDESVRRFAPRRDHVPERQCRLVDVAEDGGVSDTIAAESMASLDRFLGRFAYDPRHRPTVMLDPVERIEVMHDHGRPVEIMWRGRRHRIRHVQGPESIGVPWWRSRGGSEDADARREYWRATPEIGPWMWIFRRSSDDRWFVQGLWA